MFKKSLIVCLFVVMVGCVSSGTKIKVTNPVTGNSVTVSNDGVEVDVKLINVDGAVVEVVKDEKK